MTHRWPNVCPVDSEAGRYVAAPVLVGPIRIFSAGVASEVDIGDSVGEVAGGAVLLCVVNREGLVI